MPKNKTRNIESNIKSGIKNSVKSSIKAKAQDNSHENDVCAATCPVQSAAQILEGKWTTLIVRELLSGKKRYSELQRALPGISPKVLAARLLFLERQGILEKTIYPVIPPKTEYELSELGYALRKLIAAMAAFGKLVQA